MMSEVVGTEIEKECILLPSTYLGRGQKGIRRKEDTGDNADVDPLAVCTRAEETEEKDTGDTPREDGIEGEDDTQYSAAARMDIEHGDADGDDACDGDDRFSGSEIMRVGLLRS